ncbi:MAG: uroporphyrinogen decarboxylase family protein [Oscillospiraceae bacterium]|nr:uroporphyrinogen decarboxylase family protein [Oscillospiraceae bacterium]
MDMKNWFKEITASDKKKAVPVLSFPSTSLLGITVRELISDSDLQAKGMKAIADRCDTLAAVSMMDLSVEAEEFGSSVKVDDHEVPTVIGSILKSEKDADDLIVPSVGTKRTGIYTQAIKKACKLITDRPVFAGIIGPFSLSGRLMDMSEIMIKCFEEPEFVHKTLAKAAEFLISYAKAYKDTGANGVVIAEPAAGLLSPALIDEFSTPYVKKITDAVQDEGFAVIYHNCGNTIPLIESIKKIGAYAYHFGNAIDLREMLDIVPRDMIVCGNVDPAGQFRSGTPESVYAATMNVLNSCSKYPNFIISSGCDIPPLAPWENIDFFFKAVADFYA